MEIIKIPKKKSYENIYNQKLNVAAYVRVSTENDIQTMSFDSQLKYYKDKIHKNLNWNFVNVYADYGISGTKSQNREQFIEMLNEAITGNIDLIITKSVSRFARNTVDTLKYVRMLKEKNIGVIFEEENINTLNMSGELLLTVLSSVSQQEAKNASEHMKQAHKMRIKEGNPIMTVAKIYGYDVDRKNNKLVINPKEAEVIKMIFNSYLNGIKPAKIVKILEEKKIKNKSNGTNWYPSCIRFMLINEKYIGDTVKGKSYKEPNTYKTKVNYGENPKYYFKDTHEAIISRDDFEKVKIIMSTSAYNKQKERINFQSLLTKRDLTGKLRCVKCGNILSVMPRKRDGKLMIYWKCFIPYAKHRKCDSKLFIRDDIIKFAFIKCYNKLLKELVNEKIKINEKIGITTINNELINAKKLKEKYMIKMSILIDSYINKALNTYRYRKQEKELKENLDKCQNDIENLENKKSKLALVNKEINQLKMELKNKFVKIKKFDKELFNKLIDVAVIGEKNGSRKNTSSYLIRFIYKNKFNNKIKNDFSKTNEYKVKEKNLVKLIDYKINAGNIDFRKYGIPKVRLIDKIRITFEIESNL